jgi:ABC-type uncharacterized transport system ATPase component
MSKLTIKEISEEEVIEGFEEDIADNDYVFVLDENGDLKSVLLPDHVPMNVPKNIQRILKLFKIYDVDNLGKDATLH